jgi:hypothetical protein
VRIYRDIDLKPRVAEKLGRLPALTMIRHSPRLS